jgi:hypothetical protein
MGGDVQPTYSDRVVAFIDILGFAALVRQLGSDPALHARLHHALGQIKVIKRSSLQPNTAQTDLEVSVFSDSIVLSAEPSSLHNVVWSAIHLQSNLLALGILVRGGVSCGRTVHANDVLYGEGMLQAYYLESKAALYPRIILDPRILDRVKPDYRAVFLRQDTDGLWFLDPFLMGILPPDSESLLEDGFDPHEVSLRRLGKKIDQEIGRASDAGHLAKWNWLKHQHVIALAEFATFGKARFWHLAEMAERAKHAAGGSAAK